MACAGPAVSVYVPAEGQGGVTIFEELDGAPVPAVSAEAEPVRVVLESNALTGCGHFSRLLSEEVWLRVQRDVPEGPDEDDAFSESSVSYTHLRAHET